MALRNYSSTAQRTTLTASMTNVATTVTVAATTGFPATPFIGIIDPDTAVEEVVLVTNVAGLTLTMTRGYDSTVAQPHNNGVIFQHGFAAIDFREPNTFLNSGGTIGGNVVISGTLNPTNVADTATAASHYWVETGSDGLIRPKTLANVKSEILTNATIDNVQASATSTAADLWSEVTTGSIAIGAGLTTGALNLATAGTGATPIGIGHTNAVITVTGNTTITGTLNPTNAADTATAASHYFVETGSDGLIRPKTLANVQSEIVTTAAVNSAAATTVGTVTSGIWNAGAVTSSGAFSGTTLTLSGGNIVASADNAFIAIYGGTVSAGANIELYGGTHATQANKAFYDAVSHTIRAQAGSTTYATIDATGINNANTADTATTATHYFVETGTDGYIRPKTLANVRTEIVTTAAVNAAAATTVGTITSGVWNAGAITSSGTISATGLAGSLLSSANPLANGTAAPGTSAIPARQDHVHPGSADVAPLYLTTNAPGAAPYTLVLADNYKLVEMNFGTANTLNIPTDASVAFPTGTQINVLQVGAGQTTIAAVTPGTTTVQGTPGLKLRAQWSMATLIKRAANYWVVVGDVVA